MSKKMPPAMKYFLLPFYGNFLKMRYGLKTEGFEKVLPFDGPAVVFSNHTHILDPFLISARYPYHIRWVAGSHLFRHKFMHWFLTSWVQAITKQQGRSDIETIRLTADALKNGDIVGLFPEGTRTWDGDIADIVKGTAKLVRLFRVPVVFINIENGFARLPRWSETDTKSRISLKVTRVLTPEEIAKMNIAEISEVVQENLGFSHAAWIKEHPEAVGRGRNIAEGVERLFYACPKCHGIDSVRSHKESITCSCGAHAEMHADYTIHGDFGFEDLPSWHRWERGYLSELLEKPAGEMIFPVQECIYFSKLINKKEVECSTDLTVSTYPDRFSVRFRKGSVDGLQKRDFRFEKVESVIITVKQTVEFYYEGEQYRFRPEGRDSALKFQEIYLAWKEKN